MTRFHTNIDCAKRFVHNLPGTAETNFMVGDTVQVYQDKAGVLEMKVVGRKWIPGGYGPVLSVELGLASQFQSISDMERLIMARGFPRS